MMDQNEYSVLSSGRVSYKISVPCFFGDGDDFYYAMAMNRFYESVLCAMSDFANSTVTENVRRASYNASYSITDDASGISVTINISHRIVYKDSSRSISVRKSITHRWKDGVIVRKMTK